MIVIGGENLIDLIQISTSADGRPVYQAVPGGSPYNTAIAAARQGQPTGYLTPISSDSLGELLASHIQADNVRLLSPRASEPSSLAVVSLNNGQPSYQFYRENTAERMVTGAGLTAALAPETRIFSVGSLALSGLHDGPAWAECYHNAHARGVFCAIDPNIRPRSAGCEECLATGDTWVHLRVCLICGHVGCCDDRTAYQSLPGWQRSARRHRRPQTPEWRRRQPCC